MGAYGAGGLANNLLAAGSGGMMIALNLGYGMNPALVGLLGALPRLTDAHHRSGHGAHFGSHPIPAGDGGVPTSS